MELRRLKLSEYKEMLELLNRTFSESHRIFEDFRTNFPRIFVNPTEEIMNQHIGAFESGKLVGVTAAYPVSYNICGKVLNVIGSGNLAVDKSMRGQGIMTKLLEKEVEETKDTADILYLHGSRPRYRLYGYELCGKEYMLCFTQKVLKNFSDVKFTFADMYYHPQYAKACKEISEIWDNFIVRNEEDFIPALRSGGRKAICVLDNENQPTGYFSYNDSHFRIEEFAFKNKEDALCIFKAFIDYMGGNNLNVRLPAFDTEFTNYLLKNAESYTAKGPAFFRIANLKNVLDVMLNAKAKFHTLKDGTLTIGNDILGKVKIEVSKNVASVSEYDGQCDINIQGIDIYTFLFGGNEKTPSDSPLAENWFPLNLYIPYLT